MVEGGARVISSVIASHSDLIDVIIVTVAPVFVGDRGIAYHANLNNVRNRAHFFSRSLIRVACSIQ
jgi:riboflavin biosynthesis pyrimidine reductase